MSSAGPSPRLADLFGWYAWATLFAALTALAINPALLTGGPPR